MTNENDAVPPPTRDQFEHRKDFVRAYDRWREKHDPRRKARQKARTEAGYQKEQYAKHQEKRRAQKKALYETKREMLLERQAKWRDENREKLRLLHRESHAKNPFPRRIGSKKRKDAIKRASPPWLTKDHWAEISAIYEEAMRLTMKTGILHEVDHIWPLNGRKSCGLHVPWNLRVLPALENRRKRNGDPE